jgi:hypothetical protein
VESELHVRLERLNRVSSEYVSAVESLLMYTDSFLKSERQLLKEREVQPDLNIEWNREETGEAEFAQMYLTPLLPMIQGRVLQRLQEGIQ